LYTWVLKTWFLGRPDMVDFGGLGGPGGPQIHPRRWWASPPPCGMVFGAAQTPTINDFRPAQKPCMKSQSVCNNASGPEIGLQGRMSSGFYLGKPQKRPSGRPGEPFLMRSRLGSGRDPARKHNCVTYGISPRKAGSSLAREYHARPKATGG
jgi:hypothetical protein